MKDSLLVREPQCHWDDNHMLWVEGYYFFTVKNTNICKFGSSHCDHVSFPTGTTQRQTKIEYNNYFLAFLFL